MRIKATIDNQELEIEVNKKVLEKAGYVKTKKECKRWRAEKHGEYWCIHSVFGVMKSTDEPYDCFSDFRYSMANYYKTEKEAQKAVDLQLAIVRVNDRIMELNKGWEPKWNNTQDNYFIDYIFSRNRFGTNHSSYFWVPTVLSYIKSEELASQIISECEDDLKIIFGV